MAKPKLLAVIICIVLYSAVLTAQGQPGKDSIAAPAVTSGYTTAVTKKIDAVDARLSKQTRKAIRKFQRQEARLQKLLAKKDSTTAAAIFSGSNAYLNRLQQQFTAAPDTFFNQLQGQYNAYLDTLRNTLTFLQKGNIPLPGLAGQYEAKLKAATGKLNVLEGKMQQAEVIKKYLRERKQVLRQQLEKYGLGKKIRKLEKTVYYYGQYTREFSEALKDPKKIEAKALALLRQSKPYQKFVQQNSLLAQLFRLPGSAETGASVPSLTGLQTRQALNTIITARLGTGGPNAPGNSNAALQAIQQQVQAGMQQLSQLKDRLAQYASADADIPSFIPSPYKTKSFWQRLELGTDLQFSKTNRFMPTAADLGLGVGYKLKFGTTGIGISYKVGLGNGWRDIRFSSNGVGLRSYADIKLKNGLLLSGGYEQNYLTGFSRLAPLHNLSNWQRSGLLGISKKMQIKGKKAAKVSLLWDFLSYSNQPQSQPLVIRMGYILK